MDTTDFRECYNNSINYHIRLYHSMDTTYFRECYNNSINYHIRLYHSIHF